MEPRKITIVQTAEQKKSVIMSSATTLGELKNDLDVAGINYNDMTFYEGLSKSELKVDSSLLPKDIERNGTTTNELVFMLTNSEKKIKSGAMTRAELFAFIKEHNLQQKCLDIYGKNYTQCKTVELNNIVCEHAKAVEASVNIKETTVPECNCKCNCVDEVARRTLLKLVKRILPNYTRYYEELLNTKIDNKTVIESPYSDSEIEAMFKDMQ